MNYDSDNYNTEAKHEQYLQWFMISDKWDWKPCLLVW